MKKTWLFQILLLSVLISSCISSSSEEVVLTVSPAVPIESTNTPVKRETPTTIPTASITPAVIINAEIHSLALNETNANRIENLATFGTPNKSCLISSAIDSALETVLINGKSEYLLANADHENQNILIWNIEAENVVQTLAGTNAESILFSPDQRTLISFSYSDISTLPLWDIQIGKQSHAFDLKSNRNYDDHISISSDGLRIALFSGNGAEDWQISELSLLSGEINNSDYAFPLYRDTPPPYIYSPRGNLMAVTYAEDDKLHLLDLTNRKDTILQFPFSSLDKVASAEAFISTLSISSTEEYLAGGALNGNIYVWNAVDGTLLRILEAHETDIADGWIGGVKILEFSPASNLLLSVGYDGSTKLWNGPSGVLLKEIETCHHFGGFTQDGRYLVTIGKDGIEKWGIR